MKGKYENNLCLRNGEGKQGVLRRRKYLPFYGTSYIQKNRLEQIGKRTSQMENVLDKL